MAYTPSRPLNIETLDDLLNFTLRELEAIAKDQAETIAVDLRPVYREPERPRDGMIVCADGTEWNPGSGAGSYEYRAAGWHKL